ncbi:PAS domain S-box protein [Subsaximicrobium wynnwilliamsii]|nr:HAMP domain-containing sensor histidine kinase [Subsaximicrobium wynnwilliamsii]TXE03395.1 PAS domain S-box protein [Subsaximicrobium wynnwilliamsii]
MPEEISHVKEKLFENIFNYAKGGIAIVSPKGKWLKVNASIVDLLGYSKNEIYSMTFQDITHRDDLESDMEYFNQILSGEIDSYQIQKRFFHKNGAIVWGHINVSVFKDEVGEPRYFISQITDITAQKEAALHHNLLMDIIQDKNKTLNDFAHIATHDIRTHVGNLDSITGFIEEDCKPIVAHESFLMWKESVKNLQETLSHLDDIRTVQSSQKKDLKALPLHDYINHAIYNVAGIARKQDVVISNNVDTSLKVRAIAAYLDSIILNFLSNAIKYKSQDRLPKIEISSRYEDSYAIIDIKDNGIGIDLDKHGHQLFTLNATFSDHEDSRGIGLFITKNHIESIGGKIEVESELGKGTCFSVYLKNAE